MIESESTDSSPKHDLEQGEEINDEQRATHYPGGHHLYPKPSCTLK